MQELTIILPEKVSTNEYYNYHWKAQRATKLMFMKEINVAVKSQKIKKIIDYPFNITFCYYFTGKELDWVNCSAMTKIIEDCLRELLIITDDSPKYIPQGIMISTKSKRKYSYVVVELG